MSDYDNTNKGQVWGNDKKETANHPDFKGSIDIEGKEYWLSGWKRDPNGNPKAPAMRLSAQAKDQAHNQGMEQAQQAAQPASTDYDDSIPF